MQPHIKSQDTAFCTAYIQVQQTFCKYNILHIYIYISYSILYIYIHAASCSHAAYICVHIGTSTRVAQAGEPKAAPGMLALWTCVAGPIGAGLKKEKAGVLGIGFLGDNRRAFNGLEHWPSLRHRQQCEAFRQQASPTPDLLTSVQEHLQNFPQELKVVVEQIVAPPKPEPTVASKLKAAVGTFKQLPEKKSTLQAKADAVQAEYSALLQNMNNLQSKIEQA